MQPYFMPYIGYFQLINYVDLFVIYDNIKYTKKGWINRNRILVNGKIEYISLPLKKDSDYLDINQRFLSDNFYQDKIKLINKIKGSYSKATYYSDVINLLENTIDYSDINLFEYIYFSIKQINEYIGIKTPIIKSSSLDFDIHSYKGEEKVLAICKALNADEYINSIGGVNLYSQTNFKKQGINLYFLESKEKIYKQFGREFIPYLSIIDVLMFNDIDSIKSMLDVYEIQS